MIYALGVTTVIFGKHIDKLQTDQEKNICTLPIIIGDRASRYTIIEMMLLPFLLLFALIARGYFNPDPGGYRG